MNYTRKNDKHARKTKQDNPTQNKQSKASMGVNKKKLFQNKYLPEKLRIQIWNALVRSTLTYALQTQELTEPQEAKINGFAQNCMRRITEATDNKWNIQTRNSENTKIPILYTSGQCNLQSPPG